MSDIEKKKDVNNPALPGAGFSPSTVSSPLTGSRPEVAPTPNEILATQKLSHNPVNMIHFND